MTQTTSSQHQRIELPKPKLSIRIPAPLPDEEILRSPVDTSSALMAAGVAELKASLRKRNKGANI